MKYLNNLGLLNTSFHNHVFVPLGNEFKLCISHMPLPTLYFPNGQTVFSTFYVFLISCCSFRISYSVYELQRLKEASVSKPNIQLIMMYDVACILSKHIKVMLITFLVFKVISFHCLQAMLCFPCYPIIAQSQAQHEKGGQDRSG